MRRKMVFSYVLIALAVALVIGPVVYFVSRPADPLIQISGIQNALQTQKAVSVEMDGKIYVVNTYDAFVALMQLDQWSETSFKPTGEPQLVLEFGELWTVSVFADGKVIAYNGYAALGNRGHVYYEAPAEVAGTLVDYIREHGKC